MPDYLYRIASADLQAVGIPWSADLCSTSRSVLVEMVAHLLAVARGEQGEPRELVAGYAVDLDEVRITVVGEEPCVVPVHRMPAVVDA